MRETRPSTAVRLPPETYDRLRKEADRFGLSMNFIITKAVEDLLDNIIDPADLRLTRPRPDDDPTES